MGGQLISYHLYEDNWLIICMKTIGYTKQREMLSQKGVETIDGFHRQAHRNYVYSSELPPNAMWPSVYKSLMPLINFGCWPSVSSLHVVLPTLGTKCSAERKFRGWRREKILPLSISLWLPASSPLCSLSEVEENLPHYLLMVTNVPLHRHTESALLERSSCTFIHSAVIHIDDSCFL